MTKEEYEELKNKYTDKLTQAIKGMEELIKSQQDASKLIKRALALHALSIENQHLKELFKYNEIDEQNYRVLAGKIKRQRERLEAGLSQFKNNDVSADEKNIFERFMEKSFEKNTPENIYIRNRARMIILRKTIEDLKKLASIDFHFDKKYFDEIISLYEKLLSQAEQKVNEIFNKYKATIMSLETKLSEKTLLKLEESVIKELFEKEIITPKLYHKFMEEIQEQIYK